MNNHQDYAMQERRPLYRRQCCSSSLLSSLNCCGGTRVLFPVPTRCTTIFRRITGISVSECAILCATTVCLRSAIRRVKQKTVKIEKLSSLPLVRFLSCVYRRQQKKTDAVERKKLPRRLRILVPSLFLVCLLCLSVNKQHRGTGTQSPIQYCILWRHRRFCFCICFGAILFVINFC